MRQLWIGLLSAAALLAGVVGANAGAAVVTHPESVLSVQNAYTGYLQDYTGDLTPLIDIAALPPGGPCVAHPPALYSILVGASETIFRTQLPGPINDIDLLDAALRSRAEGDVAVHQLWADTATRADLAAAMADVLQATSCGDRVFFHFGGFSAPGALLLEIEQRAITAGVGDDGYAPIVNAVINAGTPGDLPEVALAIYDIDTADEIDPAIVDEVTAVSRFGLLFNLNRNAEDGRMELFSSDDLNSFVTLLRNRGADVVVSLDAPYADALALGHAQELAGDSTLWISESDLDADLTGIRLLPQRGDFLALYATVGNGASFDETFENDDGTSIIYGSFTFQLAQALQDPEVQTARALGESLTAIPDDQRTGDAVFRVESSNPNMTLFEGGALLEAAAEAIHITSPEPTRGPNSVKSAAIEIAGIVNWTAPVRAVLVNEQSAALEPDGGFKQTITLKNGANTVRITALMQDGRILQKNFDVVFAGDVDALKGAGTRYAVIIANSDYGPQTGFAHLATPVADADALAEMLTTKYGFVTEAKLPDGSTANLSLRNATLIDTQKALYDVSLVAGDNDTVVIYYAGHGIYEPVTTTAFWVPVDAKAGAPFTYLSASSISEAIARIQARKVVLISDSCFSGALMRGGPAEAEKIASDARVDSLLALQRRKTRLLISSGNDEPVSDAGGNGHSIFARALLDGLAQMEFDQFSARELFDDFILERVTANSKQEPQFRPLDNVGHEGGDVVFVKAAS
ncbi:MAG: caspase family protein [Devosia sp.]